MNSPLYMHPFIVPTFKVICENNNLGPHRPLKKKMQKKIETLAVHIFEWVEQI